ncbi:hypothetical protein HHI36_020318 [Cryptolaemus montrouzieri]|uniref:Uncharacterized protein n=1 Tax=Cryptolaemus montrouzieri TaxID=559131 RepID=A0ABD2NAK8_9CUCU
MKFVKNDVQVKISMKEHVRYLGVIVDRHLRRKYHIDRIVVVLRSLLHKFEFLEKILDVSRLKNLYYALVKSIWGAAAKCHMPSTYPSDELYREANLMDVRQLYFF